MKNKVPFIYKMLYVVTKLVVDFLYYRKTYYVNTKNMPSNGTPLIVVSNHQNSLNDALAILYSTDIRRLRFLARADVFKHPIASKVLYFFGLLPVFRQRDGMENVKNNLNVFAEIRKSYHPRKFQLYFSPRPCIRTVIFWEGFICHIPV